MPADGATPNFALVLPEVGASADSWGTKTNANWTTVDADMHAISAAQGNYLPLTGGTLSGGIVVGGYGINYSTYSGHWVAFGWDGYFPTYSIDGGGATGELASTAWVNGNFKNIGAYTPNQNVDVNASVQWWNDTVGGTIIATNAGAIHQFSNVSVGGTLGVAGLVSAYGNLNAAGAIQSGAGMYAGGNGFVATALDSNAFAHGWDGTHLEVYVNGAYNCHIIRSFSGSYTALFQMMVNGSTGNLIGWAVGGAIFTIPVTWQSDRALKSNIRDTTADALAALNAIPVFSADVRPVFDGAPVQHWDWTVMADDVGRQIPTALIEPDGADVKYASLREGPIIATLIRAVQQLSARVAALEAHA